MGWFSRRKEKPVLQEHKFAYVNLGDFHSKSVINWLAYIWIYAGTIISVARYAADIYTAVVLLAFNRWTNSVERTALINFDIAKWIFCGCIFLSLIICGIDWFLAVKVIKSDGVAEAYMNVIALRYNCIRGGPSKGDSGWRRFLVFSKLTESRGFVDYIALATYFSFKGWIRVIFAEGPRVAINALTFISVTQADMLVKSGNNALNSIEKFANNFAAMYNEDKVQVIVLCTMGFTSLLWVFSILRLLLAGCAYVCYLWHAMRGANLHDYCKDRIDTRMTEIVKKKHVKAIRKEKKHNDKLLRQPTIPILVSPGLKRSNTEEALSMSSTANLLPAHLASTSSSPPQSIYTTTAASSSANLNREPTIPDLESGFNTSHPMPPIPPQHQQRQTPARQHQTGPAQYNSYSIVLDDYRDPSPAPTPLQPLPPHNQHHNGGFVSDRLPPLNNQQQQQQYPGEEVSYQQFGPPQRAQTGTMGSIPRPPQGPINRGGTAPPSMMGGYRGPPQQMGGTGGQGPQGQNNGGYVTYNPARGPTRQPQQQQQQQAPQNQAPSEGGFDFGEGVAAGAGAGGYQAYDNNQPTSEPPQQMRRGPSPPPQQQRNGGGGRGGYGNGFDRQDTGMRPPPRAATAGPPMGGNGGQWGPPMRSMTAMGPRGPPPMGLQQQQQQQRGPPPSRVEDWGMRQGGAPPQQQQRGPPRAEDWGPRNGGGQQQGDGGY